MPVRLKRVYIANHSRLPDIDLEVRRHALLIGRNDVGKSSIVRCLHLALGASTSYLYSNLTSADLADSLKPMRVQVEFIEFTDEERLVFPDEISIDGTGAETLVLELEVALVPGDDSLAIRRFFPESGRGRQVTRDQFRAIGWRYLSATRVGGAEALDGRASALRALLDSVDLGPEKAALLQALANFDGALAASPALVNLRSAMSTHLNQAMPAGVGHGDLEIKSIASTDDVLRAVTLYISQAGQSRPMSEQSDGMNALVSMVFFDLAMSAANIVGIDEPETHLHPASQRTLARVLASGANQKVIATHSPFVVQKFDPEHVIAFSPDSSCRQLAVGALTAYDKNLVHWWTTSRLEPLTARYVLFVEGVADRAIVEACCAAVSVNPDALSISVVELDGAEGFKAAYRLFGPNGFDIGMIGLVDEDHEHQWADTLGISVTDLAASDIFVARADLEQEYVDAIGVSDILDALRNSGVFSDRTVMQVTGVQDLSALTSSQLAQFCRKRKVQAALIVAPIIKEHHVKAMGGLKMLIERVQRG
jgi:putative ATP-dependent endonuclease of the OLD family